MPGKRKFRKAWMQADFHPWLKQVEGDREKAFCSTCQRSFNAELTSIKRHSTCKIHLQKERELDLEQNEREENRNERTPHGMVMATILFACFIAENNLPFTTADNLVDLMIRMFPDSAIAQSLSMKRTKCTDVIKTIERTVTNTLVKKLRTSIFSVIMDESTNVSKTKSCAVIVRYYDSTEKKITTAMLDLVNVYDSDNNVQGSTGQNLYSLLINALAKYDIPLGNFIGFAADGASNIMGEHNSLCSRLRNLLPGLTVFKCICHSIHLCSSEAAKTLPRHCEDLLHSIYKFFAHSSKRQHGFKLSQEFCNIKPHKILHPSQTRWLSLHEAVRRVLEQWQPLTLYFSQMEDKERLTVVHQIVERMRDPAVFLYFTFLDYLLPIFNDFNLLFQRNSPTIHLLFDKVTHLYRSILGTFCQPYILQKQPLMTTNPCNESNYVPLNQLYLGAELHNLFQKESLKNPEMLKDVQTRCRKFVVSVCIAIRKRFDLDNPLWKMVSCLSINKSLNFRSRIAMPSLQDLLKLFPRLGVDYKNIQKLDDEWWSLDFITIPNELKHETNIETFYKGLGNLKDEEGNLMLSVLSHFALHILSLPTSNADAERVFSKVNLIKTKIRNSLQLPSIIALIAVSEEVKRYGGCASARYKVNDEMFNAVKNMYKEK